MLRLKNNVVNIKNPNTGLFESLPALVGESNYQIAVRNGFKGTETEWLEQMYGQSLDGTTLKAQLAEKANALSLSGAVGSEIQPVYFTKDGKPVKCSVTFGKAAEYNVSDNPEETETSLMTNLAMKQLINKTIPKIIEEKVGSLTPTPSYSPVYMSSTETLVFNAKEGTVDGETMVLG